MPEKETLINFRMPNTPGELNQPVTGNLTLKMIEEMTIPEFVQYNGHITNLRKQYRYDTAVFKASTAITPNNAKGLFEVGQGQQDNWANDVTDTFIKNQILSNIFRNGTYQPGELAIFYQMEALIMGMEGGTPTTTNDFVISNPAVAAFSATTDIFLLLRVISTQFYLQFLRGGQKESMVEGRPIDFPQRDGVSGASGSSATFVSAFAQNAGFGDENLLQRPQVIEGQDTWSVIVQPLAPTLTIARDFGISVRLAAYELLRQFA